MGNPLLAIGHPNLRGEQMARGALARLRTGSKTVQRDLQALSKAWFSPTSCFCPPASVPHAQPSCDELAPVLEHLDGPNFHIVGAAFSVLRAFAVVCDCRVYGALPTSLWGAQGADVAVQKSLESDSPAARLGSSALAREFPADHLVPSLMRRLDDPLFTVRWRAISVLCRFGVPADLVSELERARPARPDPQRHSEYFRALSELRAAYANDETRSRGRGG
ncbi:MAG: hypothetical protein HOW73_09425 [Polyangiaceae bacterium]|nr:hypothetical protein [Polyangiaceae bacterium]